MVSIVVGAMNAAGLRRLLHVLSCAAFKPNRIPHLKRGFGGATPLEPRHGHKRSSELAPGEMLLFENKEQCLRKKSLPFIRQPYL